MGQRVGRILFSLLGVAALAAAGLLVPHFLTPANLLNVVRQSSIIGIGAVGMTMVIVILGIDLSIAGLIALCPMVSGLLDRKSTRLNSSHQIISYAVFCLK